jgi:hypothetical protein
MIPREWIFSHRCSWMAVYVFCRNAQSKSHSDPHDVCTLSCSINCPTVNFLPNMCYLSYGETPLVNCGPRSNFLYIALPFYYYSLCLLSCITIILLPLDTLNPLFTANRWDWQPQPKLGAKYLFVSCRFHVAAGGRHAVNKFIWRHCPECHEASKHHLLKFSFFPTVPIKPWFHNWGKTCYCAHHTFLLRFPTGCTYKPSPPALEALCAGRHHAAPLGLGSAWVKETWPLIFSFPFDWTYL